MKRLLTILLLLAAPLLAQRTTVTATVKDPVGNLYANGSYNIVFVNVANATDQPKLSNFGLFPTSVVGFLDSSATMSVVLTDLSQITPSGGQWNFSICNSAGTICFNTNLNTITGNSVDITTALQAAAAPLLPASHFGNLTVTGTITGTTSATTALPSWVPGTVSSNLLTTTAAGTTQQVGFTSLITGASTTLLASTDKRIAGLFDVKSGLGGEAIESLNLVASNLVADPVSLTELAELTINNNKQNSALNCVPPACWDGIVISSAGTNIASYAINVSGTGQWMHGFEIDQGAIASTGYAIDYKGDGVHGAFVVRPDSTVEIGFNSVAGLGNASELYMLNAKYMGGLNAAQTTPIQAIGINSSNKVSIDPSAVGTSWATMPTIVYLDQDFTTANNTNPQAIVGSANNLAWTFPANTAVKLPFSCDIAYSQATANVAVTFSVQDVTVAPTNTMIGARMVTNTTAVTNGTPVNLTTTSATTIVTATPAATATVFSVRLFGLIEQPSNASTSLFQLMVTTANGADAVTVKRDSLCHLGF